MANCTDAVCVDIWNRGKHIHCPHRVVQHLCHTGCFRMTLPVFGNGLIQRLNILPKKTARAEGDESALSERQAELFRVLAADSGDVVNGCVGCWMQCKDGRQLCVGCHCLRSQGIAFHEDAGFAFIANKLTNHGGFSRNRYLLRFQNLQFHRRARTRHGAQKFEPRFANAVAMFVPLIKSRDWRAVGRNQERFDSSWRFESRTGGNSGDILQPWNIARLHVERTQYPHADIQCCSQPQTRTNDLVSENHQQTAVV